MYRELRTDLYQLRDDGCVDIRAHAERKERTSRKRTAGEHVHVPEDAVVREHRIQSGIRHERNRKAAAEPERQEQKKRYEDFSSQFFNFPDSFQLIQCYLPLVGKPLSALLCYRRSWAYPCVSRFLGNSCHPA